VPRVDIAGIELSYRDSGGEGTPVVLIHGFPFEASLWDPQFTALGRKFRLIAPDLRGFGASAVPEDPDPYSMAAFADDVVGLLDHLDVPAAVVGGLSMGGYVTLEILRRYPKRVRALVLADTRADADAPEVRQRREAQIRQVSERGGDSLVDGMVAALLSEQTRSRSPETEAALRAVMDQDDGAWIGGLTAMLGRADSSGLLRDIAVPSLIIVGEHDAIAPPDVAREMHARIAGSRLVVIEGAGHVSNLESPVAFNAALEAFLDEL
jgi:3-oxoadipate enol-lactonase